VRLSYKLVGHRSADNKNIVLRKYRKVSKVDVDCGVDEGERSAKSERRVLMLRVDVLPCERQY
jgi:hypothetical protein